MEKETFEVNLSDMAAKRRKAAEVFGLQMPVEEEKGGREMPVEEKRVEKVDVIVDSPKDMWNVLGHIGLTFHVDDIAEVDEIVEACYDLWDHLREKFHTEEQNNAITSEQKQFIVSLCDQLNRPEPDGLDMFTKLEANTLINTLMGERDAKAQSTKSITVTSSRRPVPSRGSAPERTSSRQGGNPDRPITDSQIKYIERLCRRNRTDVPEDLESYTVKEASELIDRLSNNR